MAKRSTGVGKHNKFSSYKTAKRLEVKRQMLLLKNSKRHKHNRLVNPGKLRPPN